MILRTGVLVRYHCPLYGRRRGRLLLDHFNVDRNGHLLADDDTASLQKGVVGDAEVRPMNFRSRLAADPRLAERIFDRHR